MALFTVLARNFPFDENIPLTGPVNPVKGLQGNARIVFIHEFAEIASLDFTARITEYPAKGIIEKPEIPVFKVLRDDPPDSSGLCLGLREDMGMPKIPSFWIKRQ